MGVRDTGTIFFALRQQNYAKNNGIHVFLGETSDLSEESLIDRLNLSGKEKPQRSPVELRMLMQWIP